MDAKKNSERSLSAGRELLISWIRYDVNDDRIKAFFKENNIKRVVLYGMGDIGWLCCDVFRRIGIEVEYGIDKMPNASGRGLTVGTIDEVMSMESFFDAVIVTTVYYFEEIYDSLKKRGIADNKIISIEDIIYW